jgi:transposase-like protein
MLALRALMRCGLSRGRLVISDANEGLKQAIFTLVGAAWQRCRVHFMRNALAQVPPDGGSGDPRRLRAGGSITKRGR